MNDPADAFPATYARARESFLAAAQGLEVQSWPAPLRGLEQEPLAVDVAWLGPREADAVLIVSSGCHGVEGHCGSGVQVTLLRDEAFRALAPARGVAVLFIHALNPWGFSHGRRVTHEGVDLNRNFLDFRQPRPRNSGYAELASALVPAAWPPATVDERRLEAYAAAHGLAALKEAITGGQYEEPGGLFYGGDRPTWSQTTLRAILCRYAARCRLLAWIDLHSGLGEPGEAEPVFSARDDDPTRHRAKAWWGPRITFTEDGSSSSAPLHGNCWNAAYWDCPQAAYAGITLEFGTRPGPEVLDALRFDHWVAGHPEASAELRQAARTRMREAFYTDSPAWKHEVARQGRAAAVQAVEGLGAWR